mmetsp:Transcript_30260/g.42184  ORF Transcript_30260/g.42184 Transcript_30260/m.42184 type:complete len:233 (-) Transcript_30260:164-862(-)
MKNRFASSSTAFALVAFVTLGSVLLTATRAKKHVISAGGHARIYPSPSRARAALRCNDAKTAPHTSSSPRRRFISALGGATTLFAANLAPSSHAISGGGKGYSGYTIEGEDFSGKQLVGEEFRGTMAKRVNFRGANLANAQFQKADLRYVDFTGADLSGAALEQCTLEGAIFKDTVLEGAYLGEPILQAETIEGSDFTDAVIASSFTQKELCKIAKGTNPTTGVSTRESLGC